MRDFPPVPSPRGAKPIERTAAAVAVVAVAVALLSTLGTPQAGAAETSCSSYPAPGTLAPAGAKVPAAVASRYSIFRRPQRRADRLSAGQISASLSASGLIMSGIRFVGRAAYGGRIYVVPAEHLLAYRLAPLRCIPASQRSLERELLPRLRSEYRHPALCVVVLNSSTGTCAAASGSPNALLYTAGTPGFGLVPNGVSAVTVTYETAPPRTVAVHRNFFSIVALNQSAAPCGVQWLNPSATVTEIAVGCSYLAGESQALLSYRAYVASKLSALQSQLTALAASIGSGSLAGAESAWLTAHTTWLDVGQDDGAYGCFGELGGEIDGLAAGHPLGTADPGFTGFHRVELDLWTNDDLAAAAADTAKLQGLLARLIRTPLSTWLPATATGIGNWLLRPHEVLEDALRDSLTAQDDYGSGTDLASIVADAGAVRELVGVLEPVLDPLAPGLAGHVNGELDGLVGAIDSTRVNGAWAPVQSLATRQRQQIDGDVGAALETLAAVPDLLTSTGRNAPAD